VTMPTLEFLESNWANRERSAKYLCQVQWEIVNIDGYQTTQENNALVEWVKLQRATRPPVIAILACQL
jgi:hypothetical protein